MPAYVYSGKADDTFAKAVIPRDGIHLQRFCADGIGRTDDVWQGGMLHGESVERLTFRSYLTVPVTTGTGRVLGGLAFGHSQPARFNVRHEAKIANVAGLAAATLDNARLYREARETAAEQRRRSAEAAMAAKLGLAFTKGGPLDEVLDTCCHAVLDHLAVRSVGIWTVDSSDATILVRRGHAGDPRAQTGSHA